MRNWPRPIDETGNKYGELTVAAPSEEGSGRGAAWLCKCSCGGQRIVPGGKLRNGTVISCGCKTKELRSRFIDETGKRFGRLVVISEVPTKPWVPAVWLCRCDCGAETSVCGSELRKGNTRSCGCLAVETSTTHGMSKTVEYRLWNSMLQRCYNPNQTGYERYGGRGITVCAEWRESFEAFFAHMGARPSPRHSIERIRNQEGYGPTNTGWATPIEQARNRRSNTITADKVLEVRRRKAAGEATAVVAKDLGLSLTSVIRIANRSVWADIPDPPAGERKAAS